MLLYFTMSNIFKDYEVMYCDNSLDSWMFYIGLYIWWILYYVALIVGYIVLVLLFVAPIVTIYGLLFNVKIKIKHKKQKQNDKKNKEQLSKDYISKLDNFNKKKKKKHERF